MWVVCALKNNFIKTPSLCHLAEPTYAYKYKKGKYFLYYLLVLFTCIILVLFFVLLQNLRYRCFCKVVLL